MCNIFVAGEKSRSCQHSCLFHRSLAALPTMKRLILLLLLIMIFCTERGLSLYCFRCGHAKSHADCTSSIRCSDMEKFCVSHTQQGPGEELMISKWCSPKCSRFSLEIKGSHVSSQCCQTDYCNSAGPSGARSSGVLVMGAALGSFFYIFQKEL
ncbi:lymphocyte antigen 6E-like [Pantherophis guttatus]|uniref:Lymphocyte antigen 6E-like n=1 Tax=Pantherophis guttatus TaxID=94885 RepID=A0A6P9BXG3_PANGU|nr:lymphocyte antigen 6E-like [Pantherophis guttatus]